MNQPWKESNAAGLRSSDPAHPGEPVLDLAVLVDLWSVRDGDEHFVRDLLGVYVEQAVDIVAEMRASLGADDRETFRRAAHKLAGSSFYAGAMAVATICKRLESLEAEPIGSVHLDALESEVRRVAVTIATGEWLQAQRQPAVSQPLHEMPAGCIAADSPAGQDASAADSFPECCVDLVG